jgi:AcrR family transcriptional regulator
MTKRPPVLKDSPSGGLAASSRASHTGELSRAEQGERSREAIIDAAVKLFAERGYYGVSLDQVTELSGSKRSLILYHFKSKAELWRVAAEQAARAFNAAVQVNLALMTDDRVKNPSRHNVASWLDAFIQEPNFARMMVLEGGEPGPRLDWLIEHYEYSSVPFASTALRQQLSSTVLRDALMAIFLAMSALGPLMEASLCKTTGKAHSGIYPLSKGRRDELIDLISSVIDVFEATAKPPVGRTRLARRERAR